MKKGNMIWVGIGVVAAAVIGYVAFFSPSPSDPDLQGAVGAAQQYRAEQIAEADVVLQDPEIQERLQSDFFYTLATDDESIRVAAMENATSTKNLSDLHSIRNDLLKNAKINESSRLAEMVQVSLVANMRRRGYSRLKDKGVKQAPFYVLLGARMPSILVETSFISNREECRWLINPSYQDHLAESIVKGIRDYIREISPTAFSAPADREPG